MCAEFKDDPYIYAFDSLKHIGIELWQVIDLLHEHNDFLSYVVWCLTNFHSLSGTLFDNILITDDPEYAKKFAEETWGKHKDVCQLVYMGLLFCTLHS